jgi:hypothetical protein
MRTSTDALNRESPERRVARLVAQLRNHVLWDSFLVFSPPLLLAIGLTVYLYHGAWIAPAGLLLLSGAAIGTGLLAVTVRTRPLIPSVALAARLVDDKTEAKDRFLTLATIDTAAWPPALVEHLRGETAALLERVDLRHEFPYRIKRSFYWSLLVSLIASALFYLSVPLIGSHLRQATPYEKLNRLADKMTQRPSLSPLAEDLRTLATKLQEQNLSEREQETMIQAALEQVEKQQKKEQERESRAVLDEASSTLKGLEQQSRGSQPKDSEQGSGVAESDRSQEGHGEGKQSQGSGDKGQPGAERNKEGQQAQGAQAGRKERGKETNQQTHGDNQNHPAEENKSDTNTGKELAGKTQGGSQEKLGRSRSEEIPRGAPPAERFYKPGEQSQEGVKGARYITVQLPEELVADSQGEETSTKSKTAKGYPKQPVSNVPLPAHVPDAPMEKQQLPLEYRGVIR